MGKSRKSEWCQMDAHIVNTIGTLLACVQTLLLERCRGYCWLLNKSLKHNGMKWWNACLTAVWQVAIFSTGFPANVTYQELDVPLSCVRPEHRCFLPNIWYSGSSQHDHLRLVALVSTTDIEQGDEVFSTYYTVIHWLFLLAHSLLAHQLREWGKCKT